MKKTIIAGNWKMHGGISAIRARLKQLTTATISDSIEVIVFPPAPYISQVADLCSGTAIAWGGQDCHEKDQGAFTGSVSAIMLKEWGCQYVLVGHSERRHLLGESSNQIAYKMSTKNQNSATYKANCDEKDQRLSRELLYFYILS